MQFFSHILAYFKGFIFLILIALLSLFLSQISFIQSFHISPLLIAIFISILLSSMYIHFKTSLEKGVSFGTKKLLRFGIILYGFNISLADIQSVGFMGVLTACIMVGVVLLLGIYLGVKWLKLDKELALLISIGSAICGAAAVLAAESVLKSKSEKSLIALAMVILFGLFSMVFYPLLYLGGFLSIDERQMGIFIGLSLHEVANVVASSSAISEQSAIYAIIIKMIRVILLVPVLLLLPLFFNQNKTGLKKKFELPYFALAFLAVIVFHSLVSLPEDLLQALRLLCVLSLSAAMAGLGLSIHFKSLAHFGKNAFKLAFVLTILLFILGFILSAQF